METVIYFVCRKEHLEKLREITPGLDVDSGQNWNCGRLHGGVSARDWIRLIELTGIHRNEISMFEQDGRRLSVDLITFDEVMRRYPDSDTQEIEELLQTICKPGQIRLNNREGLFAFTAEPT